MTHDRADQLRAEARNLYTQAATIENGDDRLVVILRAIELETEADMLESESVPRGETQQHAAQQQQQPQPDDDKQK
ncbi:MAG TPA: hypothetical protein VMA30_20095 [Xanthobacteraceae bacterium]|nr:hypothetical protein [Xanthobacteraceae bacterium]